MDQWTHKLDTFLDGELSAEEMHSVQEHVRTCPDCAAEILTRVQMKRATQVAARRYTPSDEFRRRLRAQIAPKPIHSGLRLWMFATAAVFAVALVAAVVAVSSQRQAAQRHLLSEVTDLHVSTLASANPVDVISTDRHTVKPWFQGKLPFTFNLPELENTPFTLTGGRMAYLNQSPGAELLYQVRKHQLSVFIFQNREFGAEVDSLRRSQNFNLETWDESGLRYFVIGDASLGDIRNLSELFKNAEQHP